MRTSSRFGATLFVSASVKKVFECQESFMVGNNCVQRGYIHSNNEFVLSREIEIALSLERMISVFDIIRSKYCEISSVWQR